MVSKIVGCQLLRQPDMAFDLSYHSCNTFAEPTSKILLCLDDSNAKDYHTWVITMTHNTYPGQTRSSNATLLFSFDGEFYNSVESTKYRHDYTYGLGNYKHWYLSHRVTNIHISNFYSPFWYFKYSFSFETEVWELENGNYKIIKPTVASQYYGLGLFAVDFNFCSKWFSMCSFVSGNKNCKKRILFLDFIQR